MPWAKQVEKLEQQARDLATSVENARRRTLAQTNERVEALELLGMTLAHLKDAEARAAMSPRVALLMAIRDKLALGLREER